MPQARSADDKVLRVTVPRNTMPLVPVAAERVRHFRASLVKAMREARELRRVAAPCPPSPTGFAATVASTACGLCEGWCCRHGGDDAYLDGQTMARVRREMPDLDAGAVVRLYASRVPAVAYEGSCIFHGAKGCTLERSLRADICNTYYCKGLTAYLRNRRKDSPRVIFAGKGDAMRSSAVLLPPPNPEQDHPTR
jgi:hypothetical protein